MRRERPAGESPLRASPRLAEVAASRAGRSALRRIRPRPASWGGQVPQGGSSLAGLSASWGIVRRGGLMKASFRVLGARPTAAHARYPPIAVPGGPPGGASLPGGPSFGRCAPARFCAVCAPCNRPWCFRWLSLRGGLVGGRLSFVMRRFPIRIFVGH